LFQKQLHETQSALRASEFRAAELDAAMQAKDKETTKQIARLLVRGVLFSST
jgi:hypothetical protein